MSQSFLAVQVAGERIALPTSGIGQVIEPAGMIPVPGTPDYIAGITSVRSNILTVLDVAKIIGAEPASDKGTGYAVMIEREGCGYAMLVESVDSIVETSAPIEGVSLDLRAAWQTYALGSIDTDEGRMLVIDTGALIDEPLLNLSASNSN